MQNNPAFQFKMKKNTDTMKSKILIIAFALATLMPCTAQNRADQQHLTDSNSFSMVLMGDPQNYIKQAVNQPIFELTTAWAADNVKNLNIQAVLITGDMVNANEQYQLRPYPTKDQNSKEMWNWVSHCMNRLDNRVPYIVCSGNHDYGYIRGDEPFTHFNEYFTLERNDKNREHVISAFPNREGNLSIENAAYEFNEPHWGKLLVFSTEWSPRDEVLDWIRSLCKKNPDHTAIILTHSYLTPKDLRNKAANTQYKIPNQNQGQEIWDKLVKSTPNIRIVLCGHSGSSAAKNDLKLQGVGYREDKNDEGKKVCQMIFNVQFIKTNGLGNGGDGWLRILEFMPDGKTIKVRTYSPLFGISPMTRKLAHRTADFDQFDMTID